MRPVTTWGAFGAASGSVRCQQMIVESPIASTGRVTALAVCTHASIAGRTWKGQMASFGRVERIIRDRSSSEGTC